MQRGRWQAKNFRQMRERFSDPLLTALTVMLAVLMFVTAPLQAAGIVAAHHFSIIFAFVMLAAVFVVSGSLAAVAAILVAIALAIVTTILRIREPSVVDIYLDATAWLISGLTLAIVVARAVFAPGQVTFHRVIGAVLLYLTIGLIFTALSCFVALLVPNAFTGLGPLEDNLAVAGNLIYFSFATLTSVGYGDIVPLHPVARGMANVEAIIGQLYPATLLARLVTLHVVGRSDR
jgi:Ion channel